MGPPGRAFLLVLLLLTAAAGAVLAGGGRRGRDEPFQRLTGGLGFGTAVDLSGGAFGFDPRLDGEEAEECGPVPGGACFCPPHEGSVFDYPPLDGGAALPAEGAGDAPPP
jgi:hypothetical protein